MIGHRHIVEITEQPSDIAGLIISRLNPFYECIRQIHQLVGTMYRTALDAVADLPDRVLLTTGPNMAEHPLGAVPSNVVVETFVPQAQVFEHARVVVTHRGSGTVVDAMATGRPLVIAPMFADRPDNARVVEAAGCCVAVFDATSPRLSSAIQRVIECDAILNSAQRVANEMKHLPSLETAMQGFGTGSPADSSQSVQ